ncbi:hypothetical protein F5I97DRAFT_1905034 [Phlebopus sp. FC_14]|nr:hypothetical protein F5I97DRAFT_1905034 [Phlebopus sp. FC_14]
MIGPADFVLAVGLVVGSFVLTVVVSCPLEGIIVRLRAQYNPKTIELDPETDEQASTTRTNAVPMSWWGMFKRVWRIEGWHGLFKGIGPTLIWLFLALLLGSYVFLTKKNKNVRVAFIWRECATALVGAPFRVITYRAITTPEKLSTFDVGRAIHVLFSHSERRRPWLIYLTPGILPILFFNEAHILFVLPSLGWLASQVSLRPLFYSVSPRDLVHFGIALISTAVITPLQVMMVRLAIQRNHTPIPTPENDTVHIEEIAEFSSGEDQVLELRTEEQPYTGLWDCAKCIITEEGFWALYRAWWWTLIECWGSPSYTMALSAYKDLPWY